MPVIVPLYPDTLLGPDTLLHPLGVWIANSTGLTLALNSGLIPLTDEPRTDGVLAYARSTSFTVPDRLTSGTLPYVRLTSASIPARVTSLSIPDRVTNGTVPVRTTSVVV